MAFNGNLHEFGIVALLQLPNSNRLSGKLSVDGIGKNAEFFYRSGKLVHASSGGLKGRDALALVIDWDEGKFSVESWIDCDETTIKEDLHHTLMWALKERDERKKKEEEMRAAEEERKQHEALAAAEAGAAKVEPEPVLLPGDLLQYASHANYACIVNRHGSIVAHTAVENDFAGTISGYLKAIRKFIEEYPEDSVGKTFIDDRLFSLGLCGNSRGFTTVLFAAPNTRLGILSMELGKFMSKLESDGLGEMYEGRGN